MSLLSFLLAQLWGNYMFWRIICQILGWKTTWKPFGKVCCYLCYCTALQQTIMIQCHFFWSKSMHQVKFSLEKWLFNPSYLIWFKRYAAAKRISPSTATFRQIIFWCIFCKLMLHNHVMSSLWNNSSWIITNSLCCYVWKGRIAVGANWKPQPVAAHMCSSLTWFCFRDSLSYCMWRAATTASSSLATLAVCLASYILFMVLLIDFEPPPNRNNYEQRKWL